MLNKCDSATTAPSSKVENSIVLNFSFGLCVVSWKWDNNWCHLSTFPSLKDRLKLPSALKALKPKSFLCSTGCWIKIILRSLYHCSVAFKSMALPIWGQTYHLIATGCCEQRQSNNLAFSWDSPYMCFTKTIFSCLAVGVFLHKT